MSGVFISEDNREGRLGNNTNYIIRYYTPKNRTSLKDVYILDALSLRELEQLLKNAKLPIVSKYYNNIEDVTDKNDAMIKAYLNGK